MSKEKPKDRDPAKRRSQKRRAADLPPMLNGMCMEFNSNREVVLEGSRGVLEYAADAIRVNTAEMIVSFFGRDLDLRCISESALIIGGYITRVEFTS